MHILRSNWNENACQITVCAYDTYTKKKILNKNVGQKSVKLGEKRIYSFI